VCPGRAEFVPDAHPRSVYGTRMHGALLTLEEAQAAVLARAAPLEDEEVPLAEAAGRVVAEDARAHVDLPPFASSAMDGFAVRAADVPAQLALVASIAAGRPTARSVGPGEAAAIATGGAVPAGADAVVPIEYVVTYDNEISVEEPVALGAHIRPQGGDVRAGETVVPAGTRLSAAQLGALAAAGVARVRCTRRPRVAVVATGTELRPPGEPLAPGEIYEANTVMLEAALAAAGADVERLASVADDEAAHRSAVARGLEADALVTSGGVSVGPHDLVRRVEAELGVEEVFWGVAVKPGKPVTFGVRGSTLVFGLPGNPVSSLVGFELFVCPAVLALQGASEPLPVFHSGRLGARVGRDRARDQLVRARSGSDGDGITLEPLTGQESHMIVRTAAATALVLVPRGDGWLEQGEVVRYLPLG
jgi:molybdopterin molybdotransferase